MVAGGSAPESGQRNKNQSCSSRELEKKILIETKNLINFWGDSPTPDQKNSKKIYSLDI